VAIPVTGGLGVLGRQPLERLAAVRRGAVSYDRAAPSGETVGGVAYVTRDLTPESALAEYVAWLRTHERSVTQG
jgi:hypothetical protein